MSTTPDLDMPLVAVALATIHGSGVIVDAAASALESDYPALEVHVVDQGPRGTPSRELDVLLADPRVHYHPQPRLGLSAAINLAARSTAAEIVAITGDDCLVARDWITEIVHGFDLDRRIGALFGNVVPAPAGSSDEFVPGCLLSDAGMITNIRQVDMLNGTTACMAVRRTTWVDLGGFDEMLGVGARFRSAEDLDFALRWLLLGGRVLQTPKPRVVHRSSTAWGDRGALIRRNWFGSGAALGKCLRFAPVSTSVALARLGLRWRTGGSAVAETYGPKPDRVAMLSGFTRGFATGLVAPIDRRTRHFKKT